MTTTADRTAPPPHYNMGYVWAISLVAALGGLMFGYDWVVISGTGAFFRRFFHVASAGAEGWAMGSALIGCLLGALLSGSLSDRFGRKRLLILAALVFVVSSVGTALVDSFVAFNVWRIAGGVAIGLASNLSPMYIAEVAPAAVRGRLVAMNQFTIVAGILLAQVCNFGVDYFNKGADRQMLAAAKAPQAGWDAGRVATELSWQLKLKERSAFIDEFKRAAAKRAAPLDYEGVVKIVDQINTARKTTDLSAGDQLALAVVGHGLESHNVRYGWRWMFGVTAVPAVLFFLLMFFVPESPRWLVKNGRSSQARGVLQRIGGGPFADQEVANIEATLVGEIERVNFRDLLEPKVLWIITFGAILAVLQQWCGMNVIFYYAPKLFAAGGDTVSDALLKIVALGMVNVVFTVIAVLTVDRIGRRFLMLLGFIGLAVIHSLLGLAFYRGAGGNYILVLTLAAMAVYALTTAPVVWVVLAEIFPNRIRGAALSIAVFSLWTACFILTSTYPLLEEHLGREWPFWIYAAICALGFLFCARYLPETKGKTLEEIERELVD
jgi:MFS family permease